MLVRNKRTNARGLPVFDVYRTDGGNFIATVEIDTAAPCGVRVLFGAMQPAGKAATLEAIAKLEGGAK